MPLSTSSRCALQFRIVEAICFEQLQLQLPNSSYYNISWSIDGLDMAG